MKARQREWIMVRLKRETHQKLRELAAMWQEASGHRMDVPCPNNRDEISIEKIVSELLCRDIAHRSRARKKASQPTSQGNPADSCQ